MFQKKKETLPEPEPLTESDIKKLKEKLAQKEKEEEELKIKNLKIEDLLPQNFGEVTISLHNNKHCVIMKETMNQDKFKTFKKSKGGMFLRDSLAYSRGKDCGKYLLIEGNNERKIVRLIEDEELLLFQIRKLIHGIIKDKPYMLLKKLESRQKLTSETEYIKQNSEHEEIVEEVMNVNVTSVKIDDDHISTGSSVSLFDD
jgi:hypothetical protein